eukprot:12079277-Alexandrium_andersonii.AAC.1
MLEPCLWQSPAQAEHRASALLQVSQSKSKPDSGKYRFSGLANQVWPGFATPAARPAEGHTRADLRG